VTTLNYQVNLSREEVAGGWRRLHNEELHNLYPSPDFVMKSRRMWAEHAARKENMRNAYNIFKGRDHSEGVDGRILLKCFLGKQGGTMCTGFIWLRIETSGRLF
jgi:hypothetical protein